MPAWFQSIRLLHIAAGMLALFIAPIAMFTVKGGRAHRRWGKVYFWTMALVALTAMVLALYRPTIFLALVAIFSFYFAFAGYRAILTKKTGPRAIDHAASAIALLGSLGLLALAIHPLPHQFFPAPAVALTFGLLGTTIAGLDLLRLLRPSQDRMAWWYNHMGRMLGSYIATVSAFSAVNFKFLPIALRWTWPSLIGVPGIYLWTRYYRRKFAVKTPPPTFHEPEAISTDANSHPIK